MTSEVLAIIAFAAAVGAAGVAWITTVLVADWAGERRAARRQPEPEPEPEPDDGWADDLEAERDDLAAGLRYAADRDRQWAAHADNLEAECERLAGELRAERRHADRLTVELQAERWHADHLAAELAMLRRQAAAARWAREQTISMRLRAEREIGFTDVESVLPVLDVAELIDAAEMAQVIPITTEHAGLSAQLAHRQRMERLATENPFKGLRFAGPRELPLVEIGAAPIVDHQEVA